MSECLPGDLIEAVICPYIPLTGYVMVVQVGSWYYLASLTDDHGGAINVVVDKGNVLKHMRVI